MKEEIIKTIETKKGVKVSLIKPEGGLPFFRYHAGSKAIRDSFRYIIKQYGLTDTATVNVQVESPVLPENDQEKFNEMLDYFLETCVKKFMDGTRGTLALTNLFGIDEGEPLNNDWINVVFKRFEEVFNPEEGNFVFEKHIGDYKYVGEGGWEFSENESENIRIYFPSTREVWEADETKDAKLIVESYQNVKVQYERSETDIRTFYLPQSFKADFYIGHERYYGASLNGKESGIPTIYHGEGIPISFDLRVYVNPYEIQFVTQTTITKAKKTKSHIQLQIKEGDCKLGLETRIELAHDDLDNIDEADVKIPMADLIVNELTFNKLGTLFEAAKDEDLTQEELDQFVDIDVLMKGKKIGDIWFMLENEDIEMEFFDGARLNISDRFIKFFDDYFNNTKEDGMPRNDAFYYRGSTSYRAREESAASLKEAQKKAIERVLSGFRKRFSRKTIDNAQRTEAVKTYFTDQGAAKSSSEENKT